MFPTWNSTWCLQCSSTMPSSPWAQHMWPGLVYWDPIFYLACVKVVVAVSVIACVRVCILHFVCVCWHVIACFWHRATFISDHWLAWLMNSGGVAQPRVIMWATMQPHPYAIDILFSRCQWHAVTLFWTPRHADVTQRRGLGWLPCNNPDIIKNKGWNTTITTY